MSPFSLADAVHVGVVELGVCTDLEVALAILDRIPYAAAAAESYMARLDCDLGCPQCGAVPRFQHPANSWELGELQGSWQGPGCSCVHVNTAPNQPLSTCSTVSS